MRDFAIKVEHLSKRYRIGLKEKQHDTLAAAGLAWLKSPVSNFKRLRKLSQFNEQQQADDIIWALQDVSFDVQPGEVVGIIGNNGAGKSTLLKVLSRITPPTEGKVILNGRVASLLEVGTGFHGEMTGRENVYLNGTILGMSKPEVDHKFDEIVAFAEVEKFIDTPVKRYSSGMRMRLAFAVAAHLEPEILLVDEVLAVGDAAFQKKCLDKMNDVGQDNRTVLFVSHNMQAIQRLCSKAYLLNSGKLITSGTPAKVIESYLEGSFTKLSPQPYLLGQEICIRQITIVQDNCEVNEYLDKANPFEIRIQYDLTTQMRNILLGFDIFSSDGTHVSRAYDMLAVGLGHREAGAYQSVYQLPGNLFQSGFYYFEVIVGIHRHGWLSRGKIRIRLNFDGPRSSDVDFPGVVCPIGNWVVTKVSGQ